MADIVEGMERNSTITEAPLAPITTQRKVCTDFDNTPLPKPCKLYFLCIVYSEAEPKKFR